VTTLDLQDEGLPARIKAARVAAARDAYTVALHSGHPAVAMYKKQWDDAELAPLVTSVADVDLFTDWPAVTMLRDWTLDGTLINTDDDENELDTATQARRDGVVLNVCIQGPSSLRNTPSSAPFEAGEAQHIDDNPFALDTVYVGLFCEKKHWTCRTRKLELRLPHLHGSPGRGLATQHGRALPWVLPLSPLLARTSWAAWWTCAPSPEATTERFL